MNQFGLHSAFEKRRSLKFSTRATAGDHRHVRISFDYKKAEIFLLAPLPHHTPIPTEFFNEQQRLVDSYTEIVKRLSTLQFP